MKRSTSHRAFAGVSLGSALPSYIREAADDLILFAENSGELYRQRQDIERNYLRKMRAGTYDPTLGAKGWVHWFNQAATQWAKEIDGVKPSVTVRQAAADDWERRERRRLQSGEYDYLIARPRPKLTVMRGGL